MGLSASSSCSFRPAISEAEFWVQETRKLISGKLGEAKTARLESLEPSTFAHQLRVGACLMALASATGGSWETQQTMGYAGGLHDVGKITSGAIRSIIRHRGMLNPQQRATVALHPDKGADYLAELGMCNTIVLATFFHHANNKTINDLSERDPFLGDVCRALQVADRTDAMTDIEGRPYLRERLPSEGLAKIDSKGGLHLDLDAIELHVLGDYPAKFTTLGVSASSIVETTINWKELRTIA